MITEPDYGSDALNMKTSWEATDRGTVRLEGTKHWAGLTGWADYWLLTARPRAADGNLRRDVDFFVADQTDPAQHVVVEEVFPNLGLRMLPYGRNRVDVELPAHARLEPHTTGVKMMLDRAAPQPPPVPRHGDGLPAPPARRGHRSHAAALGRRAPAPRLRPGARAADPDAGRRHVLRRDVPALGRDGRRGARPLGRGPQGQRLQDGRDRLDARGVAVAPAARRRAGLPRRPPRRARGRGLPPVHDLRGLERHPLPAGHRGRREGDAPRARDRPRRATSAPSR